MLRSALYLLILGSLLFGQSLAQEATEGVQAEAYLGAGLGVFLILPGLHVHLGAHDVFVENLGLRADVEYFYGAFNLAANVLYHVPKASPGDLGIYAGGGPRLAFVPDSAASFALGATLGVDVPLSGFSLFSEVDLNYLFSLSSDASFSIVVPVIRVGLNFPLDQLSETP